MLDKTIQIVLSLIIFGGFYFIALKGFSLTDGQASRKSVIIGSIIGIVSLSLLAAFRAETIGTDIKVYALPIYEASKAYSLGDLLANSPSAILYSFMAWIVSHTIDNFQLFLFFVQVSILVPVVIYLKKNQHMHLVSNAMLIFLFLYFPMTFNIMRESMAAAFMLLSSYYMLNKRWPTFIIMFTVAMLCHPSALIGLLMLILVYRSTALVANKSKAKYIGLIIISGAVLLIAVNWVSIASWAINTVHILPSSFKYYITIFSTEQKDRLIGKQYFFDLGIANYIEVAFRIAIFFLIRKRLKNEKSFEATFLRNANTFNVLIYLFLFLIFKTSYIYRLTMYLDYLNIVSLSYGSTGMKNLRCTKTDALVLITTFAFFIIYYFIFGCHEVIPYKFVWN